MSKQSLELTMFSDELKQGLHERLKRIEGQVRGIDAMLQEDKPCPQVLQQLSATAAALHGVSALVLRNYLENCMTAAIESGDKKRKQAVFDELIEVIKKFSR
jgi:CsoR family transcriptional regulator, copper-sensing transcriptional repressor